MSAGQPMVIWQQSPCPLWCEQVHGDLDAPVNRACSNDPVPPDPSRSVGLSLWKAESLDDSGGAALTALNVCLRQEPREIGPRVLMSSRNMVHVEELTVDEAEQFVALLNHQIYLARRGQEPMTASTT